MRSRRVGRSSAGVFSTGFLIVVFLAAYSLSVIGQEVAPDLEMEDIEGHWIVNTCYYGSSRPVGSPEEVTIAENTITAGLYIEKPFEVVVQTPQFIVLNVVGGQNWYESGERQHYLRFAPVPLPKYSADRSIKRRLKFSDYRDLRDAETADPASRNLASSKFLLDVKERTSHCSDMTERAPPLEG